MSIRDSNRSNLKVLNQSVGHEFESIMYEKLQERVNGDLRKSKHTGFEFVCDFLTEDQKLLIEIKSHRGMPSDSALDILRKICENGIKRSDQYKKVGFLRQFLQGSVRTQHLYVAVVGVYYTDVYKHAQLMLGKRGFSNYEHYIILWYNKESDKIGVFVMRPIYFATKSMTKNEQYAIESFVTANRSHPWVTHIFEVDGLVSIAEELGLSVGEAYCNDIIERQSLISNLPVSYSWGYSPSILDSIDNKFAFTIKAVDEEATKDEEIIEEDGFLITEDGEIIEDDISSEDDLITEDEEIIEDDLITEDGEIIEDGLQFDELDYPKPFLRFTLESFQLIEEGIKDDLSLACISEDILGQNRNYISHALARTLADGRDYEFKYWVLSMMRFYKRPIPNTLITFELRDKLKKALKRIEELELAKSILNDSLEQKTPTTDEKTIDSLLTELGELKAKHKEVCNQKNELLLLQSISNQPLEEDNRRLQRNSDRLQEENDRLKKMIDRLLKD